MTVEKAKEILCINGILDSKTLKSMYLKLIKEWHPDVHQTKEAEEKTKEINEAYEVLKNSISNDSETFEQYYTRIINSVIERYSKLNTLNIDNFNEKIKNIYFEGVGHEKDIYEQYINMLKSAVSKDHIDNIIKKQELKLNRYIIYFIKQVSSAWIYNLDYMEFSYELTKEYNSLIEECKQSKTVNEAWRKFLQITEKIFNTNIELCEKTKQEYKEMLDLVTDKYESYIYYDILKSKIEEIKNNSLERCIKIRTSFNYFNDQEKSKIEIHQIMQDTNNNIDNLFKRFSEYIEEKQQKIIKLKELANKYPLEDKTKINNLLTEYIKKLNTANGKEMYEKIYSEAVSKILQLIEEGKKIYKQQQVEIKIIEIQNTLLTKFDLSKNLSLDEVTQNSYILNKALNCLCSAREGDLSLDKVEYLKQITFEHTKKDRNIIDFIQEVPHFKAMPVIIMPEISDERILELYKRIKPIVNIEERNFLIRQFALDEIRRKSIFENLQKNITTEIDLSKFEIIDEIDCFSLKGDKNIFAPKISDVLSQIPNKYLNQTTNFQVLCPPELVSDINMRKNKDEYHLSKVRLYAKK